MDKLLGKVIGAGIIVFSLYAGWFWQSVSSFAQTPIQIKSDAIDFRIAPGSSLTAVANHLQEDGLIEKSQLFLWMIRLKGLPRRVQSGEYEVRNGMTPIEILNLFAYGKVKEYAFTIVEGWTFFELMKALDVNPVIKHLLKGKSNEYIMQQLNLAGQHPEGLFLPDTYYFPEGTTDVEFLERAHKALQQLLEQEWNQRNMDIPVKTPYKALILASIVEKETAVSNERTRIAGVFSRRLEKHMRLQTDPTVIYGLGESFDGNLTRKDLRDKKNPYNTYRINGLPPTPIAMASRDSIRAVMHPSNDNALYFVAKGDGSHYFSATAREHNKAVQKYQIKHRKSDYRSTPQLVNKESG